MAFRDIFLPPAIVVLYMLGSGIGGSAHACEYIAKVNETLSKGHAWRAEFARTKDCSRIPEYLNLVQENKKAVDAVVRHCNGRRTGEAVEPLDVIRARLLAECASKDPAPPVQSSSNSSCSDITGTKNSEPSRVVCSDAKKFLNGARKTREKYPLYSEEQYKKASESYRRAGDHLQADAVLKEATNPVAVQATPQIVANVAQLIREAETYSKAGRAAEQEDRNCGGWATAAGNYFTAAEHYFQAGDFDKAGQTLQRAVNIQRAVDTAMKNDKCNPKTAMVHRPPEPKAKDRGSCAPVLDWAKQVVAAGGNLAVLRTEVASLKAQLSKLGCEMPSNLQECLSVDLNHPVGSEENLKRRKLLRCPTDFTSPQWWGSQN